MAKFYIHTNSIKEIACGSCRYVCRAIKIMDSGGDRPIAIHVECPNSECQNYAKQFVYADFSSITEVELEDRWLNKPRTP